MLVMHGFWLAEAGLCLWAEDSELLVKSSSQAYRSARPHPFAAKQATLDGIHAGKPGEVTLLLPSLRSAPLDSPELIRTPPRPPFAQFAPDSIEINIDDRRGKQGEQLADQQTAHNGDA